MTLKTTLYASDGGEDHLRRAEDNCRRNSKTECKLCSVDDFIVWP